MVNLSLSEINEPFTHTYSVILLHIYSMLPPRPKCLVTCKPGNANNADEEPVGKWYDYFRDQDALVSPVNGDTFNCYFGGQWEDPKPATPLIIFFHGAGHTGLSFALLSKKLEHAYVTAAFDMRHHGLTKCKNEDDLSISTLVQDGVVVVEAILNKIDRGKHLPLVLCGHSLGGSVATRVAAELEADKSKGINVFAVAMLDIVEELALEALPNVGIFVHKYPPEFPTKNAAVEWSLKSILKNRESASLSIPSQLRWSEEREKWVWRVDLAETSKYWKDWFSGMTKCFLGLKASKILILAGTPHDKLCSSLTIAHMQGKYQLEILPKTGHIIQEDQSDAIAQIFLTFAKRCDKLFHLV